MTRTGGVLGLHITTDKVVAEKRYDDLDAYQCDVGCAGERCIIEPVTLRDGSTMYVDEEGLYHGADPNSIAADLAGLNGRPDLLLMGLRGDVVVVGPLDADGNDTDVTDIVRRQVGRVGSEAGAVFLIAADLAERTSVARWEGW